MAHIFENTHLWKSTLASRAEQDPDEAVRERLRNTFLSFRNRVALLAAEIHRNLPDYTVHDITHLDALWEMADIITGRSYTLTPTEALVLGGAILLHDLGMGLASYPRGINDLQKEETWTDIITAQFHSSYGRRPSGNEITNPPEDIKPIVIATLLRNLHAKHAEQLAFTHWETKSGEPPQYLIEDIEIRQIFGRAIGSIAHSHWWAVNKLEDKFPRILGAPPWCPNDWTVDPLKLACMLRVADASHIDARRAPTFLRAIRKPSKYSDEHWGFQEKLQKPYLSEDALTYTSGYAFPLKEADSWWLCLDTLSMIDRELRHVDALLADKRLPRFTARRVAAVESPERLTTFIPTEGWLPVDAHLQISDVPNLIQTLGGEELYGRNKFVPLRELIQNAADAVRARRHVEGREKDWGEVTVRLGNDDGGDWLEVQDSGIGMSAEVITRYLLDFGNSYWGSTLMLEEYPGLLASGIKQAGKYGIGFFSAFMLGDVVQIRTRRAEASQSETLVLEFNTGLSTRPLLRPAIKEEWIRDGGTIVRIWMKESFLTESKPHFLFSYVHPTLSQNNIKFGALCQALCPALDVNLHVEWEGGRKQVITASDWLTIRDSELLDRTTIIEGQDEEHDKVLTTFRPNLRTVVDENGDVVGRACIMPGTTGVITVGGLYSCNLENIGGILIGMPERAARDYARPLLSFEALAAWSSEQAKLIENVVNDPERQLRCAQIVKGLGGNTAELPIAFYRGQWMSYKTLSREANLPERIILLDFGQFNDYPILEDTLLITSLSRYMNFIRFNIFARELHAWPGTPPGTVHEKYPNLMTLVGEVINAIAESWEVPTEPILAQVGNLNLNPLTIPVEQADTEESTSIVSVATESFEHFLSRSQKSLRGVLITKPILGT